MPIARRQPVFTVGLLEIGHSAKYAKATLMAAKALQKSRGQDHPIEIMERERFGFDCCPLGLALLCRWHLPEFFPQVVENQLHLDQSKPYIRDETGIAHRAPHLCQPSRIFYETGKFPAK